MPELLDHSSAASQDSSQKGRAGVEAIQAFGIELPDLSSVPIRPRKAMRSPFDFELKCGEGYWLRLVPSFSTKDLPFPLSPFAVGMGLSPTLYLDVDTL